MTHAEHRAIADTIEFPRTAFIDGKYHAGSGIVFATVNPATGEELTRISGCNGDDVDFAMGKAREAFDQGRWSKLHPSER